MLTVLLFVSSCESFVQDIDPSINTYDDALLNDERQTDFVVTGVKGLFAKAYSHVSLFSGAVSDELVFDLNVPNATYPQYREMDDAQINLNNNSVIDAEIYVGQLRFHADTLVGRSFVIPFTDSSKLFTARYNGYLYGGIARYFYAAYFGLEEEKGGGCINLSPFIPSDQMYQLALEKLDLALQYTQSQLEAQHVHSIKARIYLILGNDALAATEAALGVVAGDNVILGQYSTEAANFWWFDAGNSRTQLIVDQRFVDYITSDSLEASRIELSTIIGNDGTTVYYYQNKYPEDISPIPFFSWQEMSLIRAEVSLRISQDTASALGFVNAVRASHGLDARTTTSLDSIYIERDKELFCTGNRLIDQRRFDRWHLAPGTWKFLPITQRERNANPNL